MKTDDCGGVPSCGVERLLNQVHCKHGDFTESVVKPVDSYRGLFTMNLTVYSQLLYTVIVWDNSALCLLLL